jgi:rod shape-determining protein MreC
MQRRQNFWPVFLIVLAIGILVSFLSFAGKLNFISSFLEKGTSAFQAAIFNTYQKLPFFSEGTKVKELEKQNLDFLSKVKDYDRLKKENQALSDQFAIARPKSLELMQSNIIGEPGFVPGISTPTVFILNRGEKDGVKKGSAVIYKENLIGIISQVKNNLSKVDLVTNPNFSITVKTEAGASGIFKGGEELTVDGITLSENVREGELVFTKGSVNEKGIGIMPDFIIGKIISVEKYPSALFQRARVESFIDFRKLSVVFVQMQIE